MFAIFLSEKMNPFYEISGSFPTIIFTILLMFFIFYWCFAVLGLVEIDVFDFDIPDMDIDADSITDLNVMAAVLFKLGLNGIPISIIASVISLLGWFISFTTVYFIFPYIPTDLLKLIASVITFVGVLYIATMLTAIIIKPLRATFIAINQEEQKVILGQTATVRTGEVNKTFGEAFVEDGGAGLIVKVRSYKDEIFKRGDKIVLLEYVDTQNVYNVISETDFKN